MSPYGNFNAGGIKTGYGAPDCNTRGYGLPSGFPPHVLINTPAAFNEVLFFADGGIYWWDAITPFPGVLVDAWHPAGVGPPATYFGNVLPGLSDFGVALRSNYTVPFPPTSIGSWVTGSPWAVNTHGPIGNAPAGLTTSAFWSDAIVFAGQRRGVFFSVRERNGPGAFDFGGPWLVGEFDYPSAIWWEFEFP